MQSHLTISPFGVPLTSATETSLQEFISGNNLFTTSLYKQITTHHHGNFLVSPLSVEIILALTQSGAKDATAEEIRTALHLPNSQEKMEAAIQTLQPLLKKNNLYTLQSANKIYIQNNFEIKDEFKKSATVFDSELENIDFGQNIAAASTMNDWVENRTNHKIKNLINEKDLGYHTRAVLINALYFKANWSTTFETFKTTKEDFYKSGTEKVRVDTMHDTWYRNYYESQELGAKFIEIPFRGIEVVFTVILPNERNGLSVLETQLEKIFPVPSYTWEKVRLALPKFKITSTIDLKTILQTLGVNKVFKGEEADLSGIAGNKGDLVVDQIQQKSFIDVNERGVEATAATYIRCVQHCGSLSPEVPPKEFIADHPFIFYIKVKDVVIFSGRVVDPSQ
ncbi:hypothetical protein Zmor_022328 [Zophobas morio]|uniref:Serpin domain-containing protein n=1 Tax=Zophobas morio TaxID=2755281 RepID=A0AA38HV64_9CUCU|nr:hypothetical protein Zmor_022328 [Zophobas morio]